MRSSSKTVRVRGIAKTTAPKDFEDFARKLCTGTEKRGRSNPPPEAQPAPLRSIASQNDLLTGTITFPSTKLKENAIKKHNSQWTFDDTFDGITVLYAAADAAVDICAVHGLGGHAFDTWSSTSKMWLRDMLPQSVPFEKSRIMTYGYDSALINSKSLQRLRDWASDLLLKISYVRTTDQEKTRPIIFVCHSMGGLVARESMVLLHMYPEEHPGFDLRRCGLLFMGTPHSGTTLADWNDFLTDILKTFIGLRSKEILGILESFNSSAVDSQKAFTKLRKDRERKYPVVKCLCESDKTRIAGKLVLVVSQLSAGLDGESAIPIANMNHHDICKFENVFDGYMTALETLKIIQVRLSPIQANAPDPLQNIPGRPRITAPHFPQHPSIPFYEGTYLRWDSSFVGRQSEMTTLEAHVAGVDDHSSKCIGVVGTGGIGKTEILLHLASKLRHQYNIFFVRIDDYESLEVSFRDFANSVGHDILYSRYPGLDTFSIWATYKPSERIREFKLWLRKSDGRKSIFMVDDLDAILNRDKIQMAIPLGAPIIIFSTRDPKLCRHISTKGCVVNIGEMSRADTIDVMKHELEKLKFADEFSSEDLALIEGIVDGHPLAASRAISYLIDIFPYDFPGESTPQKFVEIFRSPKYIEERKGFLKYQPTIGLSIMSTFEVSLARLRQDREKVENLLYLAAFSGSYKDLLELRHLFSAKSPLLQELEENFVKLEAFRRNNDDIVRGEFFAELENVSIAEQTGRNQPLQMHSLWAECLRQRIGHHARLQWMQQLYYLYWNPRLTKEIPNLELYRDRWKIIASTFGIEVPVKPKSDETYMAFADRS